MEGDFDKIMRHMIEDASDSEYEKVRVVVSVYQSFSNFYYNFRCLSPFRD